MYFMQFSEQFVAESSWLAVIWSEFCKQNKQTLKWAGTSHQTTSHCVEWNCYWVRLLLYSKNQKDKRSQVIDFILIISDQNQKRFLIVRKGFWVIEVQKLWKHKSPALNLKVYTPFDKINPGPSFIKCL